MWDLRKNYTVHKKEPIAKHLMNYSGNSTRNGFSSLLICPARITLYASCMDNVIYAYNISSYNRKPGKCFFLNYEIYELFYSNEIESFIVLILMK